MQQSETSSQRSKVHGWIRVRPRPLAATCSALRSHLDFQGTQYESAGPQATWATTFIRAVALSCGSAKCRGHLFSTTLSTLRRHPDSKVAELFGSQPKVSADAQGRYFIDRDGSHFGAVLEFLRSEKLPTENIREVYTEAVHYNIKPLIKRLEETPELFGELVGRQQFLSRVPHYKENIEVLIRIARAEAVAARRSTILICVMRTEDDLGFYDNAVNSLEAGKECAVTFGPWKAEPSVRDLLDCVKMDIESRGYNVSIEAHAPERGFLTRSYDFFYKLTFTWW